MSAFLMLNSLSKLTPAAMHAAWRNAKDAIRSRNLLRANARQVAVGAGLLALCSQLQAQSASSEPPFGLSGRIGLGVATMSTYLGSPEERTVAMPNLALSYRTREWGTVEFGQRGLTWSPLEASPFRFALVAQFDPGRKTKEMSAANPTPGDKRLAGMGDVESSVEAGVGLGYGPIMLVARQSLSNQRGVKGSQLELTIEHGFQLTDKLSLQAALGASMANQAYMQTYFGVTEAQSRVTTFKAFTPKAGLYKVDATVGVEYSMTSSWKVQGGLTITRLTSRASLSPIVGENPSSWLVPAPERPYGGSVALSVVHVF